MAPTRHDRPDERPGAVTAGVDRADNPLRRDVRLLGEILGREGVCVRAGHHCAQPLMERLQVPALTRASPYLYNTDSEVDALFQGLEKVAAACPQRRSIESGIEFHELIEQRRAEPVLTRRGSS